MRELRRARHMLAHTEARLQRSGAGHDNVPAAGGKADGGDACRAGRVCDRRPGRRSHRRTGHALVVGPLKEKNLFQDNATAAVELLAWSTKPEACPAGGCPATGGRLVAAEHLATDPLGTTGGLVSTRTQLEEAVTPEAAGPLYDPQGIVVDHVHPKGSKPDEPVAIEAKIPDAVERKHREEGAEEEYSSEEGFGYSEFEARGNTIVQQVGTEAQASPARPIGALGERWSSGELGKKIWLRSGSLTTRRMNPCRFCFAGRKVGPLRMHTSSVCNYRLRSRANRSNPKLNVLNTGESEQEPPLMRLDPGPFFTEPDDRFQPQRTPEAIRNAGPEVAQWKTGSTLPTSATKNPTRAEVEDGRAPYWRAEQHYERKRNGNGNGVEGVNVGVRVLQPVGGQLNDAHGASIVNTLGNSEPWSTGNSSSACSIDAEQPALAAGEGGSAVGARQGSLL